MDANKLPFRLDGHHQVICGCVSKQENGKLVSSSMSNFIFVNYFINMPIQIIQYIFCNYQSYIFAKRQLLYGSRIVEIKV